MRRLCLQELAGRKELAARDTGDVGNDRLDFVDPVFNQPLFGITRHNVTAGFGHGTQVYSGTALTPTWLTPTLRACESVTNFRCIRTPITRATATPLPEQPPWARNRFERTSASSARDSRGCPRRCTSRRAGTSVVDARSPNVSAGARRDATAGSSTADSARTSTGSKRASGSRWRDGYGTSARPPSTS